MLFLFLDLLHRHGGVLRQGAKQRLIERTQAITVLG